jgi:D-glycero-alpha-D-manno-heptose-7-phosphate kinase
VIVSRTPLRLSFVGGGTDLPEFYEQHGGAVVSTAIDKWIHVVVSRRFEGDIRVSYSRTEIVPAASELEHELVREGLRVTGMPRGLDIATFADVPSGTGLGSSSTVMVGLLAALYAYQGVYRSPLELAEQAAMIEIVSLGKPIGRQDQYAAAVGGLNLIEFLRNGAGVRVDPLVCRSETLERLHRSLLLFYTGRGRSADSVLAAQKSAIARTEGQTVSTLCSMRDLAYEMRDRLVEGNLEGIGHLLDRNWTLKRSLTDGITNPQIDDWYARARDAGAAGGKLLGAGQAGFLLIMAPEAAQDRVRSALNDLREVPFRFASRGTHIQLFEPSDWR